MSDNKMENSRARPLSLMLALDTDAKKLWGEAELRDLLEHQLRAPLEVDLVRHDEKAAATLASVKTLVAKPPTTFRELFLHPHPPIELLEWVKDFGKTQLTGHEPLLPEAIARFLYFASIGVARLRRGQKISQLDDGQVRAGLEWLLARPWLQEEMAALCRELLAEYGQQ